MRSAGYRSLVLGIYQHDGAQRGKGTLSLIGYSARVTYNPALYNARSPTFDQTNPELSATPKS